MLFRRFVTVVLPCLFFGEFQYTSHSPDRDTPVKIAERMINCSIDEHTKNARAFCMININAQSLGSTKG
jgi:hypothetical protein